ncbi:MAG: hypothetical protein COV29_01435 [Candidatus Yanofskybacteria bacterium CG10_big_fil_rev_8_21_14_0_10_36_16]|uniref:PsbP C-terminal domain-containing protein n=1 Tax=Candidatus Yanofskybacteria bacterium CG10_big_fil_rev_8_21_14_0_10_36_16 TaxID=1975096 RepID=A0A2J0Q776_9BACT|nr:MAG: hypothetical protein COV29_01435 [Candidatus Yanofskybacteria bacterium CG10_big_fil_rev_8_21_14_0_10_36_16]
MKNKKKKIYLLISFIVLGSLSLVYWQLSSNAENEVELYSNSDYGISFAYPKDWNFRESRGNDFTPFGIVLSDINLDNFSAAPTKAYPDKFISIAFVKTTENEDEYFNNSAAIELNNLEITDINTRTNIIKKYEGNRSRGQNNPDKIKHIYTFIRSGEYLIEITTYIINKNDEEEVTNIFNDIIKSLEIN